MTYLYICQLIIIRNCNVIMMSKISCFWISPKFHHLFGPGRPGFIELLPRDMEPTRRCLACSCLWCYACGCICGIRHTSFLNIFKYWMYNCIHVLGDAGFLLLDFVAIPWRDFFAIALRGIQRAVERLSAATELQICRRLVEDDAKGTARPEAWNWKHHAVPVDFYTTLPIEWDLEWIKIMVWSGRIRAFRANSLTLLLLWGSTQLSSFKTTCCLGVNACELRSFCTKERDHLYHPSWTLDCEKDVASLRKGTWYPDCSSILEPQNGCIFVSWRGMIWKCQHFWKC